ncbi:MAG: hypothetical protein JNN15_21185, partial [Blastocatellia bacterium]|nr:hypothetical protein [Blastocatellia bacterium]
MSSASKNELDDLSKRINELSPEKRQLLELLLGEENDSGWKQEEYVAPSNEIEQIITTVWQQVLGIKQIGVNDNFFELGGDSIQSIQIIAKTRQYGIYFTTNQLFEHPTIIQLSKIAQKRSVRQETTIATGEILLTPVQHWFFEQNLADFHHWNQSIMLEVKEGEDFALVQEAFKQLFSYHDLLQARFEKIDGVWKQWVDDNKSEEIFSYYDLSSVDQKEDEVSKLI